jgi:glycosyltransferase involved in cell wall biosynthesis
VKPQPATRIGVIGTRGVGDLQGGIERYCSSFYSELCHHGFHATIFVRRSSSRGRTPPGVSVYRVPAPRFRSLETILHSIASILAARALGIRTVHVHGIGSCLALPLARVLGMRVVVRHLGADYERDKWGAIAKVWLRAGERYAARYAESVVCLNRHIAAEFSKATGRFDGIHVVPNGVEAPPATLSTRIHDRLGVAVGEYVLAVGRLVPEKNMHVLVPAFVRAGLPRSVKLVIVGDYDYRGPYSRALNALCARDERIVMAGPVFGEELWSLYAKAGLFVLPSSHEGMSFSLLEAARVGAKIIASDIPANSFVCREFIRRVPVNSIPALGDAIAAEWIRVRSPAEVARQADYCKNLHDWPSIARQMVPLLAERDRLSLGAPADVYSYRLSHSKEDPLT